MSDQTTDLPPNDEEETSSFDDMMNDMLDGEEPEQTAPEQTEPEQTAPEPEQTAPETAATEPAPEPAKKAPAPRRKKAEAATTNPESLDVDIDVDWGSLPESTRAELVAGRAALRAKF